MLLHVPRNLDQEAEVIFEGKLPKNAVIFLEDNRLILVEQVYKLLEKQNAQQ